MNKLSFPLYIGPIYKNAESGRSVYGTIWLKYYITDDVFYWFDYIDEREKNIKEYEDRRKDLLIEINSRDRKYETDLPMIRVHDMGGFLEMQQAYREQGCDGIIYHPAYSNDTDTHTIMFERRTNDRREESDLRSRTSETDGSTKT